MAFIQCDAELTFVQPRIELSVSSSVMLDRLTARFVAQFSTNLHFCGKGNHGNAYFVSYTFVKRVVNIAGITSRKRPKYDQDLSRRMRWQMTMEHY